MSTTDYPPSGGICENCSHPTFIDEEGRTACEGCRKPTPACNCGKS